MSETTWKKVRYIDLQQMIAVLGIKPGTAYARVWRNDGPKPALVIKNERFYTVEDIRQWQRKMNNGNVWYSEKDAADYLGMKIPDLVDMRQHGKGPDYVDYGGAIVYFESDLKDFQKDPHRESMPYLSATSLGARFNISDCRLYEMRKDGFGPAYERLLANVFYNQNKLNAWMEEKMKTVREQDWLNFIIYCHRKKAADERREQRKRIVEKERMERKEGIKRMTAMAEMTE